MTQEAQIKVTVDSRDAERSLGNLQNSLKTLAAITIGSKVAKDLFDLANEVTNLNQKLKTVSDSTEQANASFDLLTGVALRTGQSLAGTVDLFQKMSNSSVFAGSSTGALATVVERFNQTLVLSGASAEGARSSLYNFSQAMSNGTLMGNDYRAQLENNSVFLKVLQKQLGVTSTELRMMSQEGRLSAEVVAKALLAADDVGKKFAETSLTLGQRMENFKTKSLEAMNNFDKLTGVTSALGVAIEFVGNNIVGILIAALGALAIIFAPVLVAMSGFIATGAAIVAAIAAIGFALQKLINFMVAAGASWDSFVAALDNGAKTLADTFGFNYTLSKDTVKINEDIAAAMQKQNIAAKDALVTTHQRNEAALQLDKALTRQLETENAKALIDMKSRGAKSIQLEIEKAILVERAKYINSGETLSKQQEQQIAAATRNKILGEENVSIQTELRDLESKKIIAGIGNADTARLTAEYHKFQMQYSRETVDLYDKQFIALLRQTQEIETQTKLRDLFRTTPTHSEIQTIGAQTIQNTPRGIDVDYLKQVDIIKQLNQMKLISDQDYANAKILLDKQVLESELALDQKIADARLKLAGVTNDAIITAVKDQMKNVQMIQSGGVAGFQGMLGAIDNVMASMSAQNRKAFEAHKALATAQAVISTYQAAAEAIAFPPGPPLSFIYVAGAIAAGMAQVAAIQSQSYSGKALGGSVMSNTPYIVGEKGPEMFVPAGSGTIVPNSDLKNNGNPVNINFNIQANDAVGFDELLVQRRSMVTQMVRDAMAENGQRSRM
jgi:tape measure domain-containing protein